MPEPKGFYDLVKIAMKDRPEKPKTVEDIWDKFLRIVFMGGKRSDAETRLIIGILKPQKLLDLDEVKKTDGDDWREAVTNILAERAKRIQDDEIKEMIKDLQKDIFRISASIKGGARFFKKEEISPEKLSLLLGTKEKTWEFIDGLAKNEDVSNIKYTKVIIWLHSMGYALDFCPPTYQVKKFLNDDIVPYYQFYDDDKYFMNRAEEFADKVKKKIKKATTRDVAMAIFYYITLKTMLPARSSQKKNFTPAAVVKFIKKKKMTLKTLGEKLSDSDERYKLMEDLNDFIDNK